MAEENIHMIRRSSFFLNSRGRLDIDSCPFLCTRRCENVPVIGRTIKEEEKQENQRTHLLHALRKFCVLKTLKSRYYCYKSGKITGIVIAIY